MTEKWVKLFLRLALATAFLSAVADRFGFWSPAFSAWGNWDNFLAYTAILNPWAPGSMVPAMAGLATVAEIIFGVFLLIGFKTRLTATLSGFLLLIFALSMSLTIGIKRAFDFSVFSASAAAFALSLLKAKFIELDGWIEKRKSKK